ncbi:hypothetical protein EDD37DRAFT_661006 [Exophiala viscosa]|uniref:uncharacterized protein n=1 Tax=Exophiala viscosa TaxID=2486360 RepID=UPI0021903839|nr:hypothetical protein EDD37DRAFT_661006 [Exophiala viscosa]
MGEQKFKAVERRSLAMRMDIALHPSTSMFCFDATESNVSFTRATMFPSSDPAIPQARSEELAAANRTPHNAPRFSNDKGHRETELGSVQQHEGHSVMPTEWLEQELIDKSRHPSDAEAGHIHMRGEPTHQSWQEPYLPIQETAQQERGNPRNDTLEASSLQLSSPLHSQRPAFPEQIQANTVKATPSANQAYKIRNHYAPGLDSFLLQQEAMANRQTGRSDIDALFESSDVEGDNSMLQQSSESSQHHPPIPGLFDHRPPQHQASEALLSNDDLWDDSGHLPEISSRLKQDLGNAEEVLARLRDGDWRHPVELQTASRQFGLSNASSAGTEPFGPPRKSLGLESPESAATRLYSAEVQEEHHVSAYHDNGASLEGDNETEGQAQFHWLSCGCAVGRCHCQSPSLNDTDDLERQANNDNFRTDPRPTQPIGHAASSQSTEVGSRPPPWHSGLGTTSTGPSRSDTPRPPIEDREQPPFIIYDLDDKILTTVEGEAYEETTAGEDSRGVVPLHHGERSSTPSPTSARGRYPEVPGWDHESEAKHIEREVSVPPPKREWVMPPRDMEMSMPPRDREVSMPPPPRETSVPPPEREMSIPPADVEMSVTAEVVFGQETASFPPVERPNMPPIPDTTAPLKQPKRGERRKSAVQGAKVDKRSVTVTKQRSKSRNVTRKPTASVGKLVEQAKKLNKASDGVADDNDMTRDKPRVAGKVAAAVNKIEKQVKQQEDVKNLKQKDGMPVRRSQRTKAARTSVP